MEERLVQFQPLHVPASLTDQIVVRLAQLERDHRRRWMGVVVLGICTIVGFVAWQWNLFAAEWNGGWIDYLRLAFSDPDILINSWRNFAAGFLEVLPTNTLFAGSTVLLLFFVIPAKAGNQFK